MSGIKKITDEVKSAVAKSVEPMKNLTTQAKSMASQSASSVSQMKVQMKSYTSSIQETTKQQEYLMTKIEDLKNSLAKADMGFEVGDTMKIEADIEKLENRLRKLRNQGQSAGVGTSNAFDKIKTKVKVTRSQIASLSSNFKNILSHSKNLSKSFTSTFNNGIKSIKKFALGLLSVRTAFSMISKAMQSYLSYDTQLSNSIQNCWNVLGSLLAPVLEYIVNLFSKAVSYVNAFVQALTGINLVARANAKAIDNQAKSTKKLNDTQSSLDEFHTINKDSSSGGSDKKLITVEPIDLSKLDFLFDWIEKAKKVLATLFDPIKQAWGNKGQAFIKSLKKAFEGIKKLGVSVFTSIFNVWTNGTGQKIVENFMQIFTNMLNIVGELGKAFSIAWQNVGSGTSIIQSIANIFIAIQNIVDSISLSLLSWVMSDDFQNALNTVFIIMSDLFRYVQDVISWIAEMYETYLAPVVDKILACISKIIVAIGLVWNCLKPIINGVIENIKNVLEPAIEGLCGIIGGIIDSLNGILDFIIGVFTGDWNKAWDGIKGYIQGVVDTISSLFSGVWKILIAGAENGWNGVKTVFSTVATFFKNTFSNAWNAVKKVFSTGGKVFDGIKDGIVDSFKSIVNALIKGINKVVKVPFDGINSALKKIRDIDLPIIGKPFKGLISTISIPQIPELAGGGVLDKETVVKVAEYSNAKSNPEIVSPRDMMKETMKEAIEETGVNNKTSQKQELEVYGRTEIDGDKLVIVYDKAKNNKGYDGGKNPTFNY
jgi:phage-related protein